MKNLSLRCIQTCLGLLSWERGETHTQTHTETDPYTRQRDREKLSFFISIRYRFFEKFRKLIKVNYLPTEIQNEENM